MYDQTSLPLQIEPTPKPLPMAWNSLPGKMPPAGREVLVQIDGHRGPAWGNRYALVAYCDQEGNWWEERHPSTEPLAGVIGWAYFDGPQPPTKAAPVKKSPKTDKEPMLIEGKDLVKGVTYYLTGMWWPDGGKPVKLKKWVRACELMKGAGGGSRDRQRRGWRRVWDHATRISVHPGSIRYNSKSASLAQRQSGALVRRRPSVQSRQLASGKTSVRASFLLCLAAAAGETTFAMLQADSPPPQAAQAA
jgi:hypothetical protein